MDDEKSKILFSHVKYSYVLTNCMGNRFRFKNFTILGRLLYTPFTIFAQTIFLEFLPQGVEISILTPIYGILAKFILLFQRPIFMISQSYPISCYMTPIQLGK